MNMVFINQTCWSPESSLKPMLTTLIPSPMALFPLYLFRFIGVFSYGALPHTDLLRTYRTLRCINNMLMIMEIHVCSLLELLSIFYLEIILVPAECSSMTRCIVHILCVFLFISCHVPFAKEII